MRCQSLPFASFLLATAMLSACAEERAPINQVQTFALDKTFFVGPDLQDPSDNPEFWAQATLIDVPYGATQESLFTSTYAQPVSRVRWFITEDLLTARLAYERVQNTDGKGVGAKTDEGTIVAAFTIEKHFDIAYDYNSTTGEKVNVLLENDTDRPWFERKYMRVDFSKNLVTDSYDLDTLSMLGMFDGLEYEPLAYYVDDPNDEDAPYFDGKTGYFDITLKAFAKPQSIDLSGFGWGIDEFPACWLEYDFLYGSWPAGSCAPVELTIRHAFRRVADFDFEPVEWDGERFQAYGGFYVERFGYNRNYGMSDEQWHRFLTHYQLWERSHYYSDPDHMAGPVECFTPDTTPVGSDPHRDLDADGTEDECEAVGPGSRCDTFTQKCTLPYSQRIPKPIPWYYTEGSEAGLFDATAISAHQWDVALRHSVMTARYTECLATGGKDCAKTWPVYFGQAEEHQDAMALALEVDDCRNGIAYPDREKNPAKCNDLADKIGKERGYSEGVIALAKLDEILVLCHSPVQFDDPPACGTGRLPQGVSDEECRAAVAWADDQDGEGDDGLGQGPDGMTLEDWYSQIADQCRGVVRVRRGDMRYHQINVIGEPQLAAPWGIYVDAEDPLNGQKIAASVNVWSTVTDAWAQKLVDQFRYIGGELTTSDVTNADYVDDWARAAEAASGGGVFPTMSRKSAQQRLSEFAAGKNIDLDKAQASFEAAFPEKTKKARKVTQQFRGVKARAGKGGTWATLLAARRKQAADTPVEATLINRMMQELFGVDSLPAGSALTDLVSPLRAGNPSVRRELHRLKRTAMAHRGACMLEAAQAPMDMTALATHLQDKFGKFNPQDPMPLQYERAEKMRQYLSRRVHHGAIVHEMGHSIGMRHNFVSSADAWFYRPQYWQLRTKNGTVTEVCKDLSQTGEDCVGPRYFDPMTGEEEHNLLHMFMQSSVMDYPGEATQDFMDLGPYDFAAARIFYGDAVAVHADESYDVGSDRATTVLDKADDFGGILGISHFFGEEDIHYSQLQGLFDLIHDCREVDSAKFKPARWNEKRDGAWQPLLDGQLVAVDGKTTRCRTQPVDYVWWRQMRKPTMEEYDGWNTTGHTVDSKGRTRVPYGFATDDWADLGNASVYTHDNGADPYEIFGFLVTMQEVMHIWDNYRRGQQDFSIRAAAERSLWRYNEKIRDGVKGLTLMRNFFSDYALEEGLNPDDFWTYVAPHWYPNNIIASGMVFDHFVRMATRPQSGPHHRKGDDKVLRSSVDTAGDPTAPLVLVPNGATGRFGVVNPGGRPIENRYADDQGEYNYERTVNAGSYYDKIHAAMLLTESVDNYISDTRQDFVDPRYRAVSVADLFPEGYRRFLANLLTGDDVLKGPRIAVDANGAPLLDEDGFPQSGIGWTSWWGEEPRVCFPADGTEVCAAWGKDTGIEFPDSLPGDVAPLDPQLGWEEQKFYIAWSLLYLPENEQQTWIDQFRIWELGKDADPGFEQRIEFHNPAGKVYVARTFGRETLFGRTVQKGISARVLEYANELLHRAYETTDGPDIDGDGAPDWYLPVYNETTGTPVVLYDPGIAAMDWEWEYPEGIEGCDALDNSQCTCSVNRACVALERYVEVPFFLRQTLDAYNLMDPQPDGIW